MAQAPDIRSHWMHHGMYSWSVHSALRGPTLALIGSGSFRLRPQPCHRPGPRHHLRRGQLGGTSPAATRPQGAPELPRTAAQPSREGPGPQLDGRDSSERYRCRTHVACLDAPAPVVA
ncbi:Dynein heavy chain 2, axonemal [Manis javanica]|nr:Dynein heavy chain 2, axonemal [Manis javanica]